MSDEMTEKKKRLPATCVRFTEDERNKIKKMHEVTGLSLPDLLKKALFERKDLERPLFLKEDVDRIMSELKRQGNNINQIAKQINSGVMAGWNESFNSLVSAYVEIRHLISVNCGLSRN